MRRIAADIIFPGNSSPLLNYVLVIEAADGKILDIRPAHEFNEGDLEYFSGALVPGFINTHCHLELSHLKNKIPEKIGLVEFILTVKQLRDAPEEEIKKAIEAAQSEMLNQGIVAVADVSNNDYSFSEKASSNNKLYYHTFVELLSIHHDHASQTYERGIQLLHTAKSLELRASLAAHAPYTVSEMLLNMISQHCYENAQISSIHIAESCDENSFIQNGEGDFVSMYEKLSIPLKYVPYNKSCFEYIIPLLNKSLKTLLVHNTYATRNDVQLAEHANPNLFWCLCPNANLYIEDRLPDVRMLMQNVQCITIGTDSFASNHTLSILEECKTIQRFYPEISSGDLFRWATLNGAKFLGITDRYGSFEIGKTAGIVNVYPFNAGDMKIFQTANAMRII